MMHEFINKGNINIVFLSNLGRWITISKANIPCNYEKNMKYSTYKFFAKKPLSHMNHNKPLKSNLFYF